MDAHDERARELYAQTIDAVGPVNFPGDAPYIGRIAAALRKAAADIAALIAALKERDAEVERLRLALKQACECTTCLGVGTIEVVTGYKDNGPNDPEEIYEHDECPECSGEKVGLHVTEGTARVLEKCT